MKNRILAVFLFLMGVTGFAGEYVDFSITPEVGVINGEINEYVFQTGSDSYTMSRLDWDLKDIIYNGVKLNLSVCDRFWISADGKFAVPQSTGNMQDYDWLGADHSRNTHYSIHDNYLSQFFILRASAGWKFHPTEQLEVVPFAAVKTEVFDFDGTDGYTQYATDNPGVQYWNEDLPHKAMSGKVISYKQERIFYNLGLKVILKPSESVDISFRSDLSVYAELAGLDNHWTKSMDYYDLMSNSGFCNIEFESEILWNLNHHNQVGLNLGCQVVPITKGESYQKSKNSSLWNGPYGAGGGGGSFITSVSLFYTLTF